MLAYVKSLAEINDLRSVATDLRELLRLPDNEDIEEEFPGIYDLYGGDQANAVRYLEEVRADCQTGECERFIAFSGKRAVGVSVIMRTNKKNVPIGIRPEAPCLSGYVCHPYRRQGIGRLFLATQLQVADARFGGMAWALVHSTNDVSRHTVTTVGMRLSKTYDSWGVYVYGAVEL
jgi:GNAT superfamily N-acetyltransferase